MRGYGNWMMKSNALNTRFIATYFVSQAMAISIACIVNALLKLILSLVLCVIFGSSQKHKKKVVKEIREKVCTNVAVPSGYMDMFSAPATAASVCSSPLQIATTTVRTARKEYRQAIRESGGNWSCCINELWIEKVRFMA